MYSQEINILKKINRFRERYKFSDKIIDFASNDYLGISENKKLFKQAFKKVMKEKYFSPKASQMVNGYSNIHKEFEDNLKVTNGFEDGIIVGSGFLANIALIESMVRRDDVLFIDEYYHASGILASKLIQGQVVIFKHNNYKDLEIKIKEFRNKRIIIAIEGVYSMIGDIAPREFEEIATKYNAILIVDEAHSSGVIGNNLLGWYDYWDIKPKSNHIKMGTLGKAYGSYGAYILASKHIISYLENRAKPIIYSTAPSIFDMALAHEGLKYILKNKQTIKSKITKYQKLIDKYLNIKIDSLIVPIKINNNKRVINLQNFLLKRDILVGAIRQPTVINPIIRLILKLDIKKKVIIKICKRITKKI
jgi:8-amino-7-oxononanoate synthase